MFNWLEDHASIPALIPSAIVLIRQVRRERAVDLINLVQKHEKQFRFGATAVDTRQHYARELTLTGLQPRIPQCAETGTHYHIIALEVMQRIETHADGSSEGDVAVLTFNDRSLGPMSVSDVIG